ncbi:hypothetical protein WA158_003129 [Blastocystis sp. Blastoise]
MYNIAAPEKLEAIIIKLFDKIKQNNVQDIVSEITKNISSDIPYQEFRKVLEPTLPQNSICPVIFRTQQYVYHCDDCSLSETSVFCHSCWDPSKHVGHHYHAYESPGDSGGCCDCGSVYSLKREGWCDKHGKSSNIQDPSLCIPEDIRMKYYNAYSIAIWSYLFCIYNYRETSTSKSKKYYLNMFSEILSFLYEEVLLNPSFRRIQFYICFGKSYIYSDNFYSIIQEQYPELYSYFSYIHKSNNQFFIEIIRQLPYTPYEKEISLSDYNVGLLFDSLCQDIFPYIYPYILWTFHEEIKQYYTIEIDHEIPSIQLKYKNISDYIQSMTCQLYHETTHAISNSKEIVSLYTESYLNNPETYATLNIEKGFYNEVYIPHIMCFNVVFKIITEFFHLYPSPYLLFHKVPLVYITSLIRALDQVSEDLEVLQYVTINRDYSITSLFKDYLITAHECIYIYMLPDPDGDIPYNASNISYAEGIYALYSFPAFIDRLFVGIKHRLEKSTDIECMNYYTSLLSIYTQILSSPHMTFSSSYLNAVTPLVFSLNQLFVYSTIYILQKHPSLFDQLPSLPYKNEYTYILLSSMTSIFKYFYCISCPMFVDDNTRMFFSYGYNLFTQCYSICDFYYLAVELCVLLLPDLDPISTVIWYTDREREGIRGKDSFSTLTDQYNYNNIKNEIEQYMNLYNNNNTSIIKKFDTYILLYILYIICDKKIWMSDPMSIIQEKIAPYFISPAVLSQFVYRDLCIISRNKLLQPAIDQICSSSFNIFKNDYTFSLLPKYLKEVNPFQPHLNLTRLQTFITDYELFTSKKFSEFFVPLSVINTKIMSSPYLPLLLYKYIYKYDVNKEDSSLFTYSLFIIQVLTKINISCLLTPIEYMKTKRSIIDNNMDNFLDMFDVEEMEEEEDTELVCEICHTHMDDATFVTPVFLAHNELEYRSLFGGFIQEANEKFEKGEISISEYYSIINKKRELVNTIHGMQTKPKNYIPSISYTMDGCQHLFHMKCLLKKNNKFLNFSTSYRFCPVCRRLYNGVLPNILMDDQLKQLELKKYITTKLSSTQLSNCYQYISLLLTSGSSVISYKNLISVLSNMFVYTEIETRYQTNITPDATSLSTVFSKMTQKDGINSVELKKCHLDMLRRLVEFYIPLNYSFICNTELVDKSKNCYYKDIYNLYTCNDEAINYIHDHFITKESKIYFPIQYSVLKAIFESKISEQYHNVIALLLSQYILWLDSSLYNKQKEKENIIYDRKMLLINSEYINIPYLDIDIDQYYSREYQDYLKEIYKKNTDFIEQNPPQYKSFTKKYVFAKEFPEHIDNEHYGYILERYIQYYIYLINTKYYILSRLNMPDQSFFENNKGNSLYVSIEIPNIHDYFLYDEVQDIHPDFDIYTDNEIYNSYSDESSEDIYIHCLYHLVNLYDSYIYLLIKQVGIPPEFVYKSLSYIYKDLSYLNELQYKLLTIPEDTLLHYIYPTMTYYQIKLFCEEIEILLLYKPFFKCITQNYMSIFNSTLFNEYMKQKEMNNTNKKNNRDRIQEQKGKKSHDELLPSFKRIYLHSDSYINEENNQNIDIDIDNKDNKNNKNKNTKDSSSKESTSTSFSFLLFVKAYIFFKSHIEYEKYCLLSDIPYCVPSDVSLQITNNFKYIPHSFDTLNSELSPWLTVDWKHPIEAYQTMLNIVFNLHICNPIRYSKSSPNDKKSSEICNNSFGDLLKKYIIEGIISTNKINFNLNKIVNSYFSYNHNYYNSDCKFDSYPLYDYTEYSDSSPAYAPSGVYNNSDSDSDDNNHINNHSLYHHFSVGMNSDGSIVDSFSEHSPHSDSYNPDSPPYNSDSDSFNNLSLRETFETLTNNNNISDDNNTNNIPDTTTTTNNNNNNNNNDNNDNNNDNNDNNNYEYNNDPYSKSFSLKDSSLAKKHYFKGIQNMLNKLFKNKHSKEEVNPFAIPDCLLPPYDKYFDNNGNYLSQNSEDEDNYQLLIKNLCQIRSRIPYNISINENENSTKDDNNNKPCFYHFQHAAYKDIEDFIDYLSYTNTDESDYIVSDTFNNIYNEIRIDSNYSNSVYKKINYINDYNSESFKQLINMKIYMRDYSYILLSSIYSQFLDFDVDKAMNSDTEKNHEEFIQQMNNFIHFKNPYDSILINKDEDQSKQDIITTTIIFQKNINKLFIDFLMNKLPICTDGDILTNIYVTMLYIFPYFYCLNTIQIILQLFYYMMKKEQLKGLLVEYCEKSKNIFFQLVYNILKDDINSSQFLFVEPDYGSLITQMLVEHGVDYTIEQLSIPFLRTYDLMKTIFSPSFNSSDTYILSEDYAQLTTGKGIYNYTDMHIYFEQDASLSALLLHVLDRQIYQFKLLNNINYVKEINLLHFTPCVHPEYIYFTTSFMPYVSLISHSSHPAVKSLEDCTKCFTCAYCKKQCPSPYMCITCGALVCNNTQSVNPKSCLINHLLTTYSSSSYSSFCHCNVFISFATSDVIIISDLNWTWEYGSFYIYINHITIIIFYYI